MRNSLRNKFAAFRFIISIFTVFTSTQLFPSAPDDMIIYQNSNSIELHKCITSNDLNGVKRLIAEGADINETDKYAITTPLITASGLGYLEIVKELVKNGAEINKHVVLGVNALLSAAGNGHLATVRFLIEKGADVNIAFGYNETPLMHAASRGHLEVVKYLIEKGADVNMQNAESVTALMFASQGENNLETVKYLVENGAKINIRNDNGNTALSWSRRNKIIYDYLLSKGANE